MFSDPLLFNYSIAWVLGSHPITEPLQHHYSTISCLLRRLDLILTTVIVEFDEFVSPSRVHVPIKNHSARLVIR